MGYIGGSRYRLDSPESSEKRCSPALIKPISPPTPEYGPKKASYWGFSAVFLDLSRFWACMAGGRSFGGCESGADPQGPLSSPSSRGELLLLARRLSLSVKGHYLHIHVYIYMHMYIHARIFLQQICTVTVKYTHLHSMYV